MDPIEWTGGRRHAFYESKRLRLPAAAGGGTGG